jgi:hypothetical protein
MPLNTTTGLAAVHAALGDRVKARETVRFIRRRHPEPALADFTSVHPYQDRRYLNQIVDDLNQAGLKLDRQGFMGS